MYVGYDDIRRPQNMFTWFKRRIIVVKRLDIINPDLKSHDGCTIEKRNQEISRPSAKSFWWQWQFWSLLQATNPFLCHWSVRLDHHQRGKGLACRMLWCGETISSFFIQGVFFHGEEKSNNVIAPATTARYSPVFVPRERKMQWSMNRANEQEVFPSSTIHPPLVSLQFAATYGPLDGEIHMRAVE